MRKTIAICIILQGMLALSAPGQDIATKSYTDANGIPLRDVRGIGQDRLGYMWFATEQGLFRYNGRTFLNESRGRRGTSLFLSQTGDTILAGLADGTILQELAAGINDSDPSLRLLMKKEVLPGRQISSIYTDPSGIIWTGISTLGVVQLPFDSLTFLLHKTPAEEWEDSVMMSMSTRYLAGMTVTSMLTNDSGDLLCGTDRGLFVFDGHRFVRPKLQLYREITTIAPASAGAVWIGVRGRGIMRVSNGGRGRILESHRYPGRTVTGVAEDIDGRVWFGFEEGGVAAVRAGTQRIYGTDDGILPGKVRSLYADPEGNLWIGTDLGVTKIFRLRYRTFTTFRSLDPATMASCCID